MKFLSPGSSFENDSPYLFVAFTPLNWNARLPDAQLGEASASTIRVSWGEPLRGGV